MRANRFVKRLAAAGLVLGLMLAPNLASTPASADDEGRAGFSNLQKDQIRELVRDYILQNPETILESVAIMQARQRAEENERAQQALVEAQDLLENAPGDPVLGNPEGTVTLVEFFDYQCGYCKAMMEPLRAVMAQYDNLRIVMKEFPILGEPSGFAARASLAADMQGRYMDFHLSLLSHRGRLTEEAILQTAREVGLDMTRLAVDMDSPEVAAIIDRNRALAQQLQIEGTPAFTIGGQLIPGAVNEQQLSALVADAAAKAKTAN